MKGGIRAKIAQNDWMFEKVCLDPYLINDAFRATMSNCHVRFIKFLKSYIRGYKDILRYSENILAIAGP